MTQDSVGTPWTSQMEVRCTEYCALSSVKDMQFQGYSSSGEIFLKKAEEL